MWGSTAMSELLKLRLALKAAGFSPIPCKGKQPLLREWQTRFDASAEEMAAWPGANTGSLCAYVPGWDADILDLEAAEAVEAMVKDRFDGRGIIPVRFGLAPKRLMIFRTDTPFSKMAAYFTSPNGDEHKIEILCDGQQAIFRGSHPDTGKPYVWHGGVPGVDVTRDDLVDVTEQDMRDLLQLVSDMLVEKFGFERVQRTGGNGADAPGDEAPRGPVDIEAQFQSMHDAASTNEAHKHIIPSLLAKGEHPDDVLKFVVDETMTRLGDRLGWVRKDEIKDVRGRIVSGYNNWLLKTYRREQGIPPWLPGEFHARWQEVLDDGGTPQMHFGNVKFCAKARQGSYGATLHTDKQHSDTPTGTTKRKLITLSPWVAVDEASLPPRAWLYGKHYQRATVSLTAGPGGMGKSSLDMVEAVAMVTARALLGEQPEEMLRVWYHNGEDPRDELDRKLIALCKYYGINPHADLNGGLFVTSGTEFPLRVAKGYANLEVDAALIRRISEEIAKNQIDVVIFDPLVTLHSVSEMDTGKMDAVIRLFAGIADENSSAADLAHHVRKPLAGTVADYDVHDIRGVGAITDAVRAARILNRMNEKDAEAAGCSEIERLTRFRVDRAKGNYSPPQAATWRQFVNVELLNGDDVGVVAPWDFPGQGERTPEKEAAEHHAEQVFLQLLDKFLARGVNVSVNFGPTYAPSKFADEKEAKASPRTSKAALKAAMARLLDSGRIVSEPSREDGRSHRLVRAKDG